MSRNDMPIDREMAEAAQTVEQMLRALGPNATLGDLVKAQRKAAEDAENASQALEEWAGEGDSQ